jgi:hypothetical protein
MFVGFVLFVANKSLNFFLKHLTVLGFRSCSFFVVPVNTYLTVLQQISQPLFVNFFLFFSLIFLYFSKFC